MTLACFAVAAIVVSNIRRGRTGRRLLAARANERAAAALGISVAGAKLYAFAVSAGIAALGGVLYAFQQGVIDYPSFTNFTSILFVGFAMIGGIGYLMGSIIGGLLAEGGLNQQILGELFPGVGRYVNLIGGASIILLVLLNQNGVAKETIAQVRWLTRKLALSIPALRERPARRIELTDSDVVRVAPRVLTVREMTVRYGATTAVDRVSLTLRPGQIVGLIGPNGAGKTSLIDAITGFTRAAAGGLSLDGTSIDKLSAAQSSRLGLGRSFQSLELFEDASVLENLRVAADPRDSFSYLRDLIWPRTPPLPEAVLTAIREFRLENDLDTLVEDLPYGKRRLLAIARTVAAEPSVVLLDEPVAGLDDAETAEVAALVRRLASQWGMSVLVVEHDMSFVMSVCDEIVVLDFGRTISEGPPHRVRRDPTVVAAYLGVEEPGEALVAAGRKEAG
jgi:sulfate-transporting ATPase